ncbi:transcription termination/antitermination protein NusG [Paludisphaera rhizosphaerae]|uniref:transcription termination/antitermination protein NusG n=1 Tax=Paludisphaera rhizosphaerae TaxID=2711216 RepID=UPI0013EBA377|nr:transcription termination/antitermination NusG family protein [Paludisphaera rhizosphaerae]
MTILAAEPDIYPPDLLDLPADPTRGRCWWCLHTKPRQEKQAARVLRKRALPHYLPSVDHVSHTPNGRKIRSRLPLFPGYLFLFSDEYERVEATKGGHLANVLAVYDQDEIQGDLRQIQRLLNSGLTVKAEPSIPVGAVVQVSSGPLEGLRGTVVRRQGRDEFVAVVRFLGRGATIELADWQVERVDDRRG